MKGGDLMLPNQIYIIVGVIGVAVLFWVIWKTLRTYFKLHGRMVVTCPETQKRVGVEVDVKKAALSDLLGKHQLRLQDCTRWPERSDCGQECLSQIEMSPENCLIKHILTDWYQGRTCVYCGKEFQEINWHDHKPALRDAQGNLVEWTYVPAERLTEILQTHQPVCWNCFIAENFRRQHPELVVDRPWKRRHLV